MDPTVTESGIWVRADLAAVIGHLVVVLEARGFVRVEVAEPGDRRIGIGHHDGWTWIQDEDVAGDVAGLDGLASQLSALGDALAVDVADSEVGMLSAWRELRRLGAASLPEAVRRVDGTLSLHAPWLAAVGGLDRTWFPAGSQRVEELVVCLLAEVGVPGLPGTQPERLLHWRRPPTALAPREHAGAPVLDIRQHPLPELIVGVPYPEELALQVRQLEGGPSRGLTLRLSGDLDALGLVALTGWHGAPADGELRRERATLEAGEAHFETPRMRVFTWPNMDDGVPTGRQLQRYRLAMDQQERVQWLMRLGGAPRRAGVHTLRVEAEAGGPSAVRTLSLTVSEAPRTPLLPEPVVIGPREARLLRAHDGGQYAVGRLCWRSWSEALGPWLLQQMGTLTHWVGQSPEVLWRHAGEHPRPPALPIQGEAWEQLFDQLASEGQLRLGLQGWLQLCHEERIELLFALPDPETTFGRQRLSGVLERMIREAPGAPVAAVVSSAGAPWQLHEAPPWWVLAGRSARWRDLDWLARNGAGPGWLVRDAEGEVWRDGAPGPFERSPAQREAAEARALSAPDPGGPTAPHG